MVTKLTLSLYLECYHIKFPVLVSTRNMGNRCTTPRDKYCPKCHVIIKVADKATQTDPGPPPPRMRDAACNTDHSKRGPRKNEATADLLNRLC